MADVLYMVIDTTTLAETHIITVAPMLEAQAIGKLQKVAGREVIGPPLEGRGFAKLSSEQLQYLYWNTTRLAPPDDYAELCKLMLEAAQALPVNDVPLATLEKEVARLCPDDAPAAKREKTAREPKAPREPGAPADAPKATSTTGLVWVLADAEFAKTGITTIMDGYDWKPLREAIMASCEANGINKATAATQYSKWKGAKLNAKAA